MTSNSASSASHCSFWSSTFRLFFETSSGTHVVDADLQMIEAGAIQPPDAIAAEQVSVRDQRGDRAAASECAR